MTDGLTPHVTEWVCLDCPQRWKGNALANRKPVELTPTGETIKAHVITTGHTTCPIATQTGQPDLFTTT